MTPEQEVILVNALRAEVDAGVIAALAERRDDLLAVWCNGETASDAWAVSVSSKDLFEAIDVTKFDNLTAGKRDAWRMLLDFAPQDFSRTKARKATLDVWGATDSVAVLQACTRKATRAETYFGGTPATTNTVTALKLTLPGLLATIDVAMALNRNP